MPKKTFRFISHTLLYFFLLLPVAVFISYHLAYWNKSYPGVKVGELRLGNRTKEQLEEELAAYFALYQEPTLEVKINNQTLYFDLASYGFSYDSSLTADRALEVGRSGGVFSDIVTKIKLWRFGETISPSFDFGPGGLKALSLSLSRQAADFYDQPQLVLSKGQVRLDVPAAGRVVDREKFEQAVWSSLGVFNFSIGSVEELSVDDYQGLGLAEYQEQAQLLLEEPVRLSYLEYQTSPPAEELLSFIDLYLYHDTHSSQVRANLQPNLATINDYVSKIAEEVDREPQTESFRLEEGKVTTFRPSLEGRRLNRANLITALVDLVGHPVPSESVIELQVDLIDPPPPREVNPWGIKELLGVGESNFAGSSVGRVNNVELGSSRLHGILIPPGEEFSFNDSVGEVTKATGYYTSYVISGGRTVLGVGGGMCQVSTTLFRAALNAGLPITERLPHDYRVHYYEPPVGFDATVYQPSVDLKFINDTPDYLLIQTVFSRENNSLRFELYGTSDGRQVSISEPVIHYQVPPPEPLYQDDPNLPVGVIKQIDWAAWGAKVSFTRRVTLGEQVLQDDTFVSVYRPWQAVFLRGTKEI